jgi:hypothetical protein
VSAELVMRDLSAAVAVVAAAIAEA